MKKLIIGIFCILSTLEIYPMYEKRYTTLKIADKDVIFPVQTTSYIEDLLYMDNPDAYYELAQVYFKLGHEKIADKYIKMYEEKTNNFELIAEYYSNKKNYIKEIEYLEKASESKTLEEKNKIYSKIKEVILKNDVKSVKIYKYEISNLDKLKFLISDEKKFYNFFYENEWSLQEKKEIAEFLMTKDLSKNPLLNLIFSITADKYQKLENIRLKISNIEDKEGYFRYFKSAEEMKIKIELRDLYEEIYYVMYKDTEETYNIFLSNLINDFLKNSQKNELYKLYKITGKTKILYNLSLENEDYFFEFINIIDKKFGNSKKENILNLSFNFLKKYSESKYKYDIKKIILKYNENEKDNVLIAREILKNNFDLKTAEIYLETIKNLEINQFINREDVDKNDEENISYPANQDENATNFNSYINGLNNISDEISNSKKISEETNKEEVEKKEEEIYNYENTLKEIIIDYYPHSKFVNMYINQLKKEKRDDELKEVLENLCNKDYYFEYCIKNNIAISSNYEKSLIDYYFRKKEYEKLINYKDKLEYSMYEILIENGYTNFKESANKKYPFEIKWQNKNDFKFFYFNENEDFINEEIINKIMKKDIKTDADIYYLAKYYNANREYEKAKMEIENILDKYSSENIIVDFFNEIEENIKKDEYSKKIYEEIKNENQEQDVKESDVDAYF